MEVGALKSTFIKGDLGGFSGAYKIPPAPFRKGGDFSWGILSWLMEDGA
jgi:hypothetical protein